MNRSTLLHHARLLAAAGLLAALAACGSDRQAPPAALPSAAAPKHDSRLALVPAPASMTPGEGRLALANGTTVLAGDEAARAVAGQFAALLERGRGIRLRIGDDKQGAQGAIRFVLDPARADTGREAYLLEVTPAGATVRPADAAGLFHGAMTLLQLATLDAAGACLPAVRSEDAPLFSWRGLMIVPARPCWRCAQAKQRMVAMALHKLNVLHCHLTDDQGWRVEIRKYPKLTEVGGCRIPAGDGGIDPVSGQPRPYCGYYTQDQVREIVAYAAARHITVVPEINQPGHATEIGRASCREGEKKSEVASPQHCI